MEIIWFKTEEEYSARAKELLEQGKEVGVKIDVDLPDYNLLVHVRKDRFHYSCFVYRPLKTMKEGDMIQAEDNFWAPGVPNINFIRMMVKSDIPEDQRKVDDGLNQLAEDAGFSNVPRIGE